MLGKKKARPLFCKLQALPAGGQSLGACACARVAMAGVRACVQARARVCAYVSLRVYVCVCVCAYVCLCVYVRVCRACVARTCGGRESLKSMVMHPRGHKAAAGQAATVVLQQSGHTTASGAGGARPQRAGQGQHMCDECAMTDPLCHPACLCAFVYARAPA